MTNGLPHANGSRTRRLRPRARTVVPLALAAWAVLEIWLLATVAGEFGALAVVLPLGAGLVGGAAAVKRAGLRAWRNLVDSVQRGEPPAEGSGAGAAMLGGLLLMVPGLLSDAVGLLLLFPPTRAPLRRAAERVLAGRRTAAPGSFGDAFRQARSVNEQMRIHRPGGKVVPGEVVREDGGRAPGGGREDAPRPPLTP
ncbi:FxsA family membrane protein [Streptomyces thermolineatus]|uniref:FxsA family membrane protein n=1 Tax=Streptomyces thermolineatus TaxID=44033 RepID=UPI00384B0690